MDHRAQVLDVRWDYSVAARLGGTMPSYVGLSAKESAADENVQYGLFPYNP